MTEYDSGYVVPFLPALPLDFDGLSNRKDRHKLLVINGLIPSPCIDRSRLQHLVDFLDERDLSHEEGVAITELVLDSLQLSHPSDGGLNVLTVFFARSDTTLTTVSLRYCDVGSQEDASQLLVAFHTNRTVTDLTIQKIRNLDGAALGAAFAGLLRNMPHLQRLSVWPFSASASWTIGGVCSFQPGLGSDRSLKILNLYDSQLGHEGFHLIADALVGNTTMIEILNVAGNDLISNSLDDITRMLESSSQLQAISVRRNEGVFDDDAATQRFAHIISRQGFLKELHLLHCRLRDRGIRRLAEALVGNSTIKVLDIGDNGITPIGLAAVTLLLESTQLQSLKLTGNGGVFGNDASTQSFASVLSTRQENLKKLILNGCELGDGGFRLIANALIGNTIMEVLDIADNRITSLCRADITRLLEATQLKTIALRGNDHLFGDDIVATATRHFVKTLQQKKSSVQELSGLEYNFCPCSDSVSLYLIIQNSLTRNRQLNRVAVLLTASPPPPPPPPQHWLQQRNDRTAASLMMLKTWHKAIAKLATVPDNAGTSAIFKLFTARPQLLEKRLKRPVPVATAAAAVPQEQKRRRV
jgi:Ran GTPase-activating protein (RanGAP) involved in mRNA processing and transport